MITHLTHKHMTEKEAEANIRKLHKENPDLYLSVKEWIELQLRRKNDL